ncbi:tetratricopeptide repeat protein [Myxococcota bacterium]|nr:tetratricopeptide repeat protein [Myxococcota bacterium]MBU1512091.1 tetratricopeptide repeat protein [Myxococcota bacterium]
MKHLVFCLILMFTTSALAWKVKRDEFNPAMIDRYKSMLVQNPDDDFAFRKLTVLYQTHSSLDRLILEYRSIVEKNPRSYVGHVILGKLYLRIDRIDESLVHLEKARAIDDKRYESWKLLGELHIRRRLYPEARKFLDAALEKVPNASIRERMLRELVRISILGGDLEGGAKYFTSLVKLKPNDFQTRWDYAELLTEAMQFELARTEYAALMNLSAGDTRRKIDVLKATGVLLERMGKDTEAVELYWKAIALTASGHWVRNELIGKMVSIARRRDELPKLLRDFKKRWSAPSGFQATILAAIHGELGEFDAAFNYYRLALRKEPGNVDYRLEFISLLEKSGAEPQLLISEQEALVRAAPAQTRFAVELAKRYEKAGRMKQALSLAENLLVQYGSDASVLLGLADLFGQWNKPAKVIQIYERLVVLEPTDHEHYVNLGQQYWGRGDRLKAVATWEKILKPGLIEEPGEAHFILSGVYLEAGRLPEALAQAKAAVAKRPKETKFMFQLGTVMIKNQLLKDAERVFESSLDEAIAQMDVVMAKKIRKQLLKLWEELNSLEREMNERLATWKPDQTDRGMFLAEGYLMLGKWETTLELFQKMRVAQPSLSEPLLGIIALYEGLGRYRDYITALEEAVKLIPHRAKEFYEQLSAAWAVIGDDAKARLYLQMALEKDAKDSKSWAKAGELAIKLEDYKNAIKSFQEAIRLDPYEMSYYFELAFLQQQEGQLAEAASTYHQIIARASEDEVVERAARFALELGEITGQLGRLEKVLHPLSFTYAHRPVFSRLLLETYRRYVPQLFESTRRAPTPAERKAAREELERVATRALKPLLESLASDNAGDMENARSLLAQLGNPNAAIPLVRMARRTVEAAQKKMKEKPETKEFLPKQDLNFVLKSLMVAAYIGDTTIIPDLQFFTTVRELHQAQLFALWGLSRLAPKSPEFTRLLSSAAPYEQMVLACFTVATVSRAALVPVIENSSLPAQVRARCLQAYAVYALPSESAILDTWLTKFSGFEIRTAVEDAMVYAPRQDSLAVLAGRFWKSEPRRRVHFAQGLLLASGIRDKNQLVPSRPLSLRFEGPERFQPWLRQLFDQAPDPGASEENASWQQVLAVSASANLTEVSINVADQTIPAGTCPRLEKLADVLGSALGNLQTQTPRELESLLLSWGPDLTLSGFADLCDGKSSQALGRALFPKIVPRLARLKNHPYASVRKLVWHLMILHDPKNLKLMLAEEKWPDTREGVLDLLSRNMSVLSPLSVPFEQGRTVREQILLLQLATHPDNAGHPEMIRKLLASVDIVQVSIGLARAQEAKDVPFEWLLPALSHESLTVSRLALEELTRRYPQRVTGALAGLTGQRRRQLVPETR